MGVKGGIPELEKKLMTVPRGQGPIASPDGSDPVSPRKKKGGRVFLSTRALILFDPQGGRSIGQWVRVMRIALCNDLVGAYADLGLRFQGWNFIRAWSGEGGVGA